MKKEKIIMSITIGISCFVLVMVMFMQFKIVNETDITSIETMTESELRSELISWKEKYEQLSAQYSQTLVKTEEYKEEYKTDEETRDLLKKELQELKMLLGTTDVIGKGIIIVISEDGIKNDRINYEDLLYITNALKASGAEAISINDQRITQRTDIFDIRVDSNAYVKVNGKRVLAPYTIKAIGNQTYLESTLLGIGGYIDELQKYGFKITIERSDNVQINKYYSELKSNYINN